MHIVIIGNGISGITAARELRKKSDCQISIISEETAYFFSRTALMYVYMGHMKFEHTKPFEDWFWKKNNLELIHKKVENIDFNKKKLYFSDSTTCSYDKLILATGSKPNKFGWKGENTEGVQGLYSYQDLIKLEEHTPMIQTAVIVGGGLIGVEMAEMLKSRGKNVVFLVRESSFWDIVLPKDESEMINQHIISHHIDLRLNTELDEILSNEKGQVSGIRTSKGEIIQCEFVGLAVGVSPNIGFLKNTKISTHRGILINDFFETNIDDVYAIGDCAEHQNPPEGRKKIEQIWYTGKLMGEALAENILGKKIPYQPGVFYNSAKFLDIEYQTYGTVNANPDQNTLSVFWKHLKQDKLVRINFEKESHIVLGVNTFGIRMRQEVWTEWIKKKNKIEFVLENLNKANFDPEFFKRHEREIVECLKKQMV